MGTKVHTNGFLPKYHNIIDLDGDTGTRSSYRDSQMVINGQDHRSFASQTYNFSHFGHETDEVRQTILKHESIFKNQVQELHRIYRKQRDLMNEVTRREVKVLKEAQSSQSTSEVLKANLYFANAGVNIANRANGFDRGNASAEVLKSNLHFTNAGVNIANRTNGFDLGKAYPEVLKSNLYLTNAGVNIANQTNGFDRGNASSSSPNSHIVLQDFFRNSLDAGKTIIGKQSAKPIFSQFLPAESKNELSSSPLGMGKSLSRKKRKIFGVEISEEDDDDDDSYDAASNTSVLAFSKKESDSKLQAETPNGGLPWFLQKTPYDDEPSKRMKSSYVMNLDSLQNFSQNFFRKGEISNMPSQRNEISASKILGFPIPNMVQEVKKDLFDLNKTNNIVLEKMSDLRCGHIDLNLPLDEEDTSSAPLIPTAVVKLATTEIDLEAPVVFDSEPEESSELIPESDKHLVDALIYISSSVEKNSPDEDACELPESSSLDLLKSFAEIATSEFAPDEEDSVPDGMDYFEHMTLNSKDVKEDKPVYNPPVLDTLTDDETGGWGSTPQKRSRRGQPRRRKDFQKDVLPGLVTLSRHEVAEDMHAFDEICKAGGGVSRYSQRKGKGRKCLGSSIASQMVEPVEQEVSKEMGIETRGLAGWGKRTRRLPRQRCPNGYPPFVVKS